MTTDAAQREDLATIGSTLKVLVRVGEKLQHIERTHLPEQEVIHAATLRAGT